MNRNFQRQRKFHVRKVKCLVRATERKMSVWRMETSDDRLDATKLVFLCVFNLIYTACPKIWAKPLLKNAKLPGDVCCSKPENLCLFKLPCLY